MKIFILGHKGMLGRYVYALFKDKGYDVVGLSRKEIDAGDLPVQARAILSGYGAQKDDVVINCIGVIKSVLKDKDTLNAIKVNSLFPHVLANVCEEKEYKLIHITTDCVFSGLDGNYNEDDLHDCTDVYGKTKSLGEPSNCTVIRTSIIGDEVGTSRSLIEWVKSQQGNTINGYTNHRWNGLTCHHLAKVIEDIIKNEKYWDGVRHIYSPNDPNKFELVSMIIEAYNLDIKVERFETLEKCDRTLTTNSYDPESFLPFSMTFNIPDIMTQLVEQCDSPPNVD